MNDSTMRGQDVQLRDMQVTYPNGYTAVQPTNLGIRAGEFFSILGPSGCGKTTILRAISGFVAPSHGQVLIGDRDMAGIGPAARPTALIFQNLALFPLMPVWENVAFGLEARGMGKRARRARAQGLLELVALGDQGDKLPSELSGGQRQRVAIARALAVEPAVLLLDEPLSALDLKLRQHMRAELREIQRKTGVTFIYITHDQGEALTMSDRIAVMNDGVVEQVGTCDEIYARPATAFAASFVGEMNALPGRVTAVEPPAAGDAPDGPGNGAEGYARIETAAGPMRARNPRGLAPGDDAILFVRPERMRIGAAENAVDATLARRDLEGAFINYTFHTATGQRLVVHQTNADAPPAATLSETRIGFDAAAALVLPEGPMARTGQELAAQ